MSQSEADEINAEMRKILTAARDGVVWCWACQVRDVDSGEYLGHVDCKDYLFAQGLIQKHGGWISRYEITEAGRTALDSADPIWSAPWN